MIDLIQTFFTELLGVSLHSSIYEILAFTLVASLFVAFVSLFSQKQQKMWQFAVYVCIGVMAILAISTSTGFSLNFGG